MSDPQTPVQAFAAALAAFQKDMPHVGKDQEADTGKYAYAYADLTAITVAAAPLLAANGLSFTAKPTMTEGTFVLRYALKHTGGHEEGGDYPLPDPVRSSPQQIGSAITYGRRYCLCAVTGIAPGGEDDDGQKAADARAVDQSDPFRTPKRAQKRNARDIDPATDPDPWATEVVTDAAWLDGFRQRITAAGSQGEVRGLWQEAAAKFHAGELSSADRIDLEAEMTSRSQELTPQEVPA